MPRNSDREMELWEHLAELRGRIFRSLLYIALAMMVSWFFYNQLFAFLRQPLEQVLKNPTYIFTDITQPFMLRIKVSLVAGLILALPLLTLEMWGFVAPGLTPEEKRGFHMVVPLSLLFFLMGVTTAYLVLPSAYAWFASFLGAATLFQNPQSLILFAVKMMLAFGVVFQLPVVLMFLAWIGVVNSRMLKENWRTALVLTTVLGAVATPGQDPFSMIILSMPLVVLYFASIWLVGLVERTRTRRELKESAGMGTP